MRRRPSCSGSDSRIRVGANSPMRIPWNFFGIPNASGPFPDRKGSDHRLRFLPGVHSGRSERSASFRGFPPRAAPGFRPLSALAARDGRLSVTDDHSPSSAALRPSPAGRSDLPRAGPAGPPDRGLGAELGPRCPRPRRSASRWSCRACPSSSRPCSSSASARSSRVSTVSSRGGRDAPLPSCVVPLCPAGFRPGRRGSFIWKFRSIREWETRLAPNSIIHRTIRPAGSRDAWMVGGEPAA
jgi:hypothetical protein